MPDTRRSQPRSHDRGHDNQLRLDLYFQNRVVGEKRAVDTSTIRSNPKIGSAFQDTRLYYSAHAKVDIVFVIEGLAQPEEWGVRRIIPLGRSIGGAHHMYKGRNDTSSSQETAILGVESMTSTQTFESIAILQRCAALGCQTTLERERKDCLPTTSQTYSILRPLPNLFVETPRIPPHLLVRRPFARLIPEPPGNVPNNLSQQILADPQIFSLYILGMQPLILPHQKLFHRRSLVRISIQASAQRAAEFGGNLGATYASGWVRNGDAGVHDRHDTVYGVRDVRKGGTTVHHLVENAAQAPDVGGFAEFHEFAH